MIRGLAALPTSNSARHNLIDDRYTAVNTYPAKYCGFAIVSIRSAAKFSLEPGERRKLWQFLKPDLLEPSFRRCGPERRVARNAPDQFCGYFWQEKGFVVGNGCLQFVHASGASEMAQRCCVENEANHSPVSNSPRSSSSDMASGSGRSVSSTEWWSSSIVLAAVSCLLR